MSVKIHVKIEAENDAVREFNYDFDKVRINLGRDNNNDVVIPLVSVSRKHASIYKSQNNQWLIEELGSTH